MQNQKIKILKNSFCCLIAGILFLLGMSDSAQARNVLHVVTTTTTLASLTREIAGPDVEIHSVAPPKRDIHFISPTPKDVLKVKKADVFIHGGLDLEVWRDPLLDAAGNRNLLAHSPNSIDVSKDVQLLEAPTSLSRAEGDIHQFGNPHYWTDPENAKIMARNIADGLSALYPDQSEMYQKNEKIFSDKLDSKIQEWKTRLKPYAGTLVIAYHKDWPYFANRFELKIVDHLEPKPGIPPTPKHLAELISLMTTEKVRLIIRESFQEERSPQRLAEKTGAKVVTLSQSVAEFKGTDDYISLMEFNVHALEEALKQ